MILFEAAPKEFQIQFTDVPAYKLGGIEVLEEIDGTKQAWPGKHKNVFTWWKLANGKCVGWNENPGKGWSFPVK